LSITGYKGDAWTYENEFELGAVENIGALKMTSFLKSNEF
jgi:hypothetical protein